MVLAMWLCVNNSLICRVGLALRLTIVSLDNAVVNYIHISIIYMHVVTLELITRSVVMCYMIANLYLL